MKKLIFIIFFLISMLTAYYFYDYYITEKKIEAIDKNEKAAEDEKNKINENIKKIEKQLSIYKLDLKENNSTKIYDVKIEKNKKLNLKNDFFEIVENKDKIELYYKTKKYFEINIKYYSPYRLAILIDDVGMNTASAYEFNKIKSPITFATLPFLPKTKEATDILKKNGFKVILHMPMENSGNENLNKKTEGLIRINMSNEEVEQKFENALKSVGKVDGFNNHMGSKFTADKEKMEFLLELAKKKNLYYIDSWTTSKSVAYSTAKEKNIKTYRSSVFLDNEKDVEYIKERIKIAVNNTLQEGKVIAIGHYHNNMAKAIYEMLDYIEEKNVELVFTEELLE